MMKRSFRGTLMSLSVIAWGWIWAPVHAEVLVPSTSEWKYLHPTDGEDPAKEHAEFHQSFYLADFDDTKWKSGKDSPGPNGGFAYGEEDFQGIDLTQPTDPAHRKSAYFRLKFTTTSPQKDLALKCRRDDAIVVYLDGKEIFRENLPEGDDKYDLFAKETIAGDDETKLNTFPLKLELPAGEHVLAISLHNRPEGSSDLRLGEVTLESDVKQEEAASKAAAPAAAK